MRPRDPRRIFREGHGDKGDISLNDSLKVDSDGLVTLATSNKGVSSWVDKDSTQAFKQGDFASIASQLGEKPPATTGLVAGPSAESEREQLRSGQDSPSNGSTAKDPTLEESNLFVKESFAPGFQEPQKEVLHKWALVLCIPIWKSFWKILVKKSVDPFRWKGRGGWKNRSACSVQGNCALY
jgi:hypothetical protein